MKAGTFSVPAFIDPNYKPDSVSCALRKMAIIYLDTPLPARSVRHSAALLPRHGLAAQVGILPFHSLITEKYTHKGCRPLSVSALLLASLGFHRDGYYPLLCSAVWRGCPDFPLTQRKAKYERLPIRVHTVYTDTHFFAKRNTPCAIQRVCPTE